MNKTKNELEKMRSLLSDIDIDAKDEFNMEINALEDMMDDIRNEIQMSM